MVLINIVGDVWWVVLGLVVNDYMLSCCWGVSMVLICVFMLLILCFVLEVLIVLVIVFDDLERCL